MSNIVIDARKISSGSGRYIFELISHLEKIDHENQYQVLVLPDEASYYKPGQPNFKVVIADFPHYSLAEQLGFNSFLKKLNADLVHFWMPQQPLLYTRPAVTTVHDLTLLRITSNDDMGPIELVIKKAIFAGLLFTVAHRTKHVLAPSQFSKDDLVKFAHIDPAKVTVTYEGAHAKRLTSQAVPGYENTPFIMYLGRAEPYKNNRSLIEAHQTLLTAQPNLRLLIVGAKDILRQSDIAWCQQNNYQNVDFVGFLPDEQVAWLYEHCQAYVIPSLMEGFNLPGIEALKYGAPVVSSNTTCLPEVYGQAAHYFDPYKPGDLARAINDVLINKKLRDLLKTAGAVQVKKYSWLRMAEQTLAVYNQVLSN